MMEIPLGWKLPTYQKVTGMVLGHSKTGKTRSETTWPGKTVHAAFDPTGHRSLRRRYKVIEPYAVAEALEYLYSDDGGDTAVMNYGASNISTISASHLLDQCAMVQSNMFKAFIADANAFVKHPEVVSAFFLDGLTGFSQLVRGFVLSNVNRKEMSQKDWGLSIDKILEAFNVFCNEDNKVSFILLAHIQTSESDGELKEQPLIFGKQLPSSIMMLFDIILRTKYEDKKYWWVTHPTDRLEVIGSRLHDAGDLNDLIPQDWEALLRTIKTVE